MIRAFLAGWRDGREQLDEFRWGLTYACRWKSEAYDLGVNIGQWWAR